jgi:hypothetical protein
MPCGRVMGKASDGDDVGVRYTPEMIEVIKLALELRARPRQVLGPAGSAPGSPCGRLLCGFAPLRAIQSRAYLNAKTPSREDAKKTDGY